jgi:hypothetical protein
MTYCVCRFVTVVRFAGMVRIMRTLKGNWVMKLKGLLAKFIAFVNYMIIKLLGP